MTMSQYDEETIRVYNEMRGGSKHQSDVNVYLSSKKFACEKCGKSLDEVADKPCPITDCIEKVAFFMRDKCDHQAFEKALASNCLNKVAWFNSTPEQWIKAAVNAWRMI